MRFGIQSISRLVCATALLAAGCSGRTDSAISDHDPVIVSRGLITASLSRYIDDQAEQPFERFSITGVFARYDLDYESFSDTILATTFSEPDLELDACMPPVPAIEFQPRRPEPGQTAIELIDVGNFSVLIGKRPTALPTRTFPDLLKVVDGVIYSAEESRRVGYEPGETYSIQASGTDVVAPFEVVLQAPDDLSEITIDGVSPYEQTPSIKEGEELEIAWEGRGYGDEVTAEIGWTSMGLPWKMTCRMRDDGLFVVPQRYTRNMHDPMHSGDEELTLTRVRQVSFRSEGLSSGTFAFVVSSRFPVRLEDEN